MPEIVVGDRHLREITSAALAALSEDNKPEFLFRRAGTLCRVTLDEKRIPYIETLGEAAFRGCLERSCNFVRITGKSGPVPISPPLDVVRDALNCPDEWQFPPLLGITEAPVLRPDGSILTKPGYDAMSKLYYHPAPGLVLPPIRERPSDGEVAEAIALVMEPLADFPFDNEASKANALATMFAPILRPMIDGPVPLALIDKPQHGTGATLLAEVISLIATGRAAAVMTAQKDDEGWRKVITSLLLKGQLVATIDNVEFDLWAPSLAALLTANTFQDRILGRSEMLTLPNRTTWLATGNNIRLRGDLPRRCIWVRMDARMARPWQRDSAIFKHPDLSGWVSENRGALLAAALTIARAWAVAGMPKAEGLPALGGYESYCKVIGAVLHFMEVPGFLGNLSAMYDETDTDTPQWEGFLDAWLEFVGEGAITVAELIGLLSSNAEFKDSLPDSLAGRDGRDYSRRLGHALAKRNGVRFPSGLMISKDGTRKRAVAWRVVSYGVSYQNENLEAEPALAGELGELCTTPAYTRKKTSLYRGGVQPNSPNSLLNVKGGELTHPEPENKGDAPLYPVGPCSNCGCTDFWLSPGHQWLCERCHPKLGR